MKVAFSTTPATQHYCTEVVECLVRFGGVSEQDAIAFVNSYWSAEPEFTEEDFRLHEDPYYWAMWILYPFKHGYDWTQDPSRQNAPADLLERWYGQPPTP